MRRRAPAGEPRPAPVDVARYRGRPWTAEGLTAWLVARAAWRESSTDPLPALGALERAAVQHLGVPRDLVEAEMTAGKPEGFRNVDGEDGTR